MPRDAISDFIRLLAEEEPARPRSELFRLELKLREIWGGQRVYLCSAPSLGKVARLAAGLGSGLGVTEAANRAGLSRAWGYRLARRRWLAW